MKRGEVPAECIGVHCPRCDEWLAVFPDAAPAERRQILADHRALCQASLPR